MGLNLMNVTPENITLRVMSTKRNPKEYMSGRQKEDYLLKLMAKIRKWAKVAGYQKIFTKK